MKRLRTAIISVLAIGLVAASGSQAQEDSAAPITPVDSPAPTPDLGVAPDLAPSTDEQYEEALAAFKSSDVVRAMTLLEPIVALDHTAAIVLLASILDKSGEDTRAVELYLKAAEQGSPEAELELGAMFSAGDGVERDHAKALHWIERAAEHGHGPAIVSLAEAYEKGKLSLEPDLEVAISWLERGAAAGYEPAQTALDAIRKQEVERAEVSEPDAAE
ncbi:MAG: sel1 repeat family protein [Deltaproteobacteria bacterium]|nr:sel1 repeat family protein [Deltaproteobacteria bacterium]